MTAEPAVPGSRLPPAPLRVDVFLLAGQFPGRSAGDALRDAVAYGEEAERAGFDGAWIAEHHFLRYGTCPSAPALAAHLLGRTTRLRVGTAACILSNRHPVALAEEAALLSEVSGGRFDLGVARGGPWIDLEVFGTGLDRFRDGFAESLDLLLSWLSGDSPKVGADGKFFRFPPVDVVPAPSRRVPVYVAATSPETAALAAARGLPMLLGMHASAEEKSALVGDAGVNGHVSAHVGYVAGTVGAAQEALRAAMPGWLASTGEYVRIDGTARPRRDLDAYLQRLLNLHPVGTVELCVDRLAETVAVTGVRHLLLMVEGAGDAERTLANIARLGAEVLPLLKDRCA
ncbi:LLM class flavin-dependent oxidoreductase [Paractinoplanes rishiriensis]|uniref:Alkanal monooxygenase n=1 Tax=Paractinoplanes rishiriensis TaxID=1050105 RepID=A0A919MX91_9ACTN|nr:LLM class flavin-dependent oxidoreductase [Actinoplanes rishiriensis]GIE98648.1 alkanal monooxygenase [Actinoplanes rishiriensis]